MNDVNPHKRLAEIVYYDDSLRALREKSEMLLEASEPHMEELFAKLGDQEIVVTLSDYNGIIISEKVSDDMWKRVEAYHFLSGADWSEKKVGTNAIGTTLVEQRPVQVFSGEHFCEGWHPWVCSSAPIRDPITKEVLGVLNITGEKHLLLAHNIDLVTNYARQIERNIGLNLMKNRTSPLHSLFNRFEDPVIIFNLKGQIKQMNKMAKRYLNLSIGESVFSIPELHFVMDHHQSEMLTKFTSVEINDMLWDINVYSYKYGGCVLGSMAIFRRKQITLSKQKQRYGCKGYEFNNIITENKEMKRIIEKAKKAAYSDLNVVVYGGTGTGKEVLVQSIHHYGNRAKEPFVAINCGAIPEDLVASELFGYEAGAFTGAKSQGKKGKFELAHKGTIFLDEISELPLNMQLYLLRVLEEREIVRIGGNSPIPIDVRVICATNKHLLEEVEKGNFREDLYYRLQGISLTLPSLRERKDDIPLLVNSFISESKQNVTIDDAALHLLMDYSWPGNVRQLKNCIDQALFNMEGNAITVDALPEEIVNEVSSSKTKKRREIDKEMLLNTLKMTDGNITEAANKLGVSRMTIYRRKSEFNIE